MVGGTRDENPHSEKPSQRRRRRLRRCLSTHNFVVGSRRRTGSTIVGAI
jgi:hypothetical protein